MLYRQFDEQLDTFDPTRGIEDSSLKDRPASKYEGVVDWDLIVATSGEIDVK